MIHGLGGNLFHSEVGVLKSVGANAHYSIHYPVSETARFAAGISLLVENRKLDVRERLGFRRDHLAPELRGLQHVRLVDRAHAPGALPRRLERHARDAAEWEIEEFAPILIDEISLYPTDFFPRIGINRIVLARDLWLTQSYVYEYGPPCHTTSTP